MMKENPEMRLEAISLLDGRNWKKVACVSDYFSEFALIKYRIKIEIAYFIFLSQNTKLIRRLTKKEIRLLQNFWKNFTKDEALKIKEIEKKINHDVKAVEYFIRNSFKSTSLADTSEFIHFGLTSYDINIPAYALMLDGFRKEILIPKITSVMAYLKELIIITKKMPMLSRTHGQPALPTTMGKELAVYYDRLKKEKDCLMKLPFEAKLTGAVGNYNALNFVSPQYDWILLSKKFIHSLGLVPNIFTTQIIPYDSWIRFFDSLKRLNNILLGFCQDIWWYISFEYFLQQKKEEEVGSSTMSHKINPITFENAEGNLGLANSLLEFFGKKLAVSRLQRDLSDSTVKRDFGLAFGFTLLAWDSILAGLGKITPNPVKMKKDLNEHWEIFSEGMQTYLRCHGYKQAFELLKEKTRGRIFNKKQMHELIESLPLKKSDKEQLKIVSLDRYLGKAKRLAELAIKN